MASTTNGSEAPEDQGFRLTGRHVLTILLSVFGVIFCVNAFMIWRAVGSFPGTVTESSYRDSQHFNAEIAAGHAQAERGWQVDASAERGADGHVRLAVVARDAKGQPIPAVTFKARLEHPANRSLDRHATLTPTGNDGHFEGTVNDVAPGKWTLVVEGDGTEGRLFLSHTAIMLR